jgi:hypothetical protein
MHPIFDFVAAHPAAFSFLAANCLIAFCREFVKSFRAALWPSAVVNTDADADQARVQETLQPIDRGEGKRTNTCTVERWNGSAWIEQ